MVVGTMAFEISNDEVRTLVGEMMHNGCELTLDEYEVGVAAALKVRDELYLRAFKAGKLAK